MENRESQLSSAERQLLYESLKAMIYCFILMVCVCLYVLINYTQPKHPGDEVAFASGTTDSRQARSLRDTTSIDLATVNHGKSLFRNNCGACHARDMQTDLTGPALGGVKDRWAEYPTEDLYRWIRNSKALINAGHPRAVKLSKEWEPNAMNAFPNLKDKDIDALLAYIDYVDN